MTRWDEEVDLASGAAVQIARPAMGRLLDPSIERFRARHDVDPPQVDDLTHPSASPDGSSIAFMKDDHELWLHRAGRARCIVRARRGTEPSLGRWAIDPAWSPDARLLAFCSTTARRLPEPRSPALLERAAERYGRDSDAYLRSLEHSHWMYAHRIGIVDWAHREVWMSEGHCRDVAWAPG